MVCCVCQAQDILTEGTLEAQSENLEEALKPQIKQQVAQSENLEQALKPQIEQQEAQPENQICGRVPQTRD